MRRVKKSRNGCARCKSKRVKCGEEKPHCNRCTRLGVRCPGYVQSLRWVTSHSGIQFENATVPRTADNTATPRAAQSPAPRSCRAPEGFIEPLPTSPSTALGEVNYPGTIGTTTATLEHPNPSSLEVGETDVLYENLWDLDRGSLPELDDLSPPSIAASTSAASTQQTDSPFAANLATTDLSNLFSLAAPAFQDNSRNYGHFSPAAIVRSYPPPSLRPQRIPQPLNGNSPWTLIEYYFKEVAALFSSYDSQMNPFRTTVSRLWGSSLAMCRTMQSMAAATLVHDFPQLGPMGLKMRDEAVDILTKETEMDDKSLLALLMLGQTASWHDPKDLGISFFNLLRKHLNGKSSGAESFFSRHSKNYQFFAEALVYWEMLLSFVADNDSLSVSDTTSEMEDSLVLQRVPHPWTGIARNTQSAVQEVGRLVRRERKRIRAQRFTSQEDIIQAQRAIDQAQQLEERLLGLAHPAEAEIISPGDDDTPVWHLLTMAEAYRCTGLIQLYRVFPDLLRSRLPLPDTNTTDPDGDPFLSDPILGNDCNLDGFEFPWLDTNSPKKTSPETTTTTTTKTTDSFYNAWLTEFTLTTLSRLKTIPMESRTRCVQPFLFVASSSELRLPTIPMDESSIDKNTGTQDNNSEENVSHAVEVLRTRKFVLGRLTSYLHVLPPKPIHVCLQLVKEVWGRIDAGESDVYWMDVMMERGWETTMG